MTWKGKLFAVVFVVLVAITHMGKAAVILSEDFENGDSGWSDVIGTGSWSIDDSKSFTGSHSGLLSTVYDNMASVTLPLPSTAFHASWWVLGNSDGENMGICLMGMVPYYPNGTISETNPSYFGSSIFPMTHLEEISAGLALRGHRGLMSSGNTYPSLALDEWMALEFTCKSIDANSLNCVTHINGKEGPDFTLDITEDVDIATEWTDLVFASLWADCNVDDITVYDGPIPPPMAGSVKYGEVFNDGIYFPFIDPPLQSGGGSDMEVVLFDENGDVLPIDDDNIAYGTGVCGKYKKWSLVWRTSEGDSPPLLLKDAGLDRNCGISLVPIILGLVVLAGSVAGVIIYRRHARNAAEGGEGYKPLD